MEKRAGFFSDGTENYVTPMEPKAGEAATIRFRALKGSASAVRLVFGESKSPMALEESRGGFDFFALRVLLSREPFSYFFEIQMEEGGICFYGTQGVSEREPWEQQFRILPGFSTPDWAKGAVMYQIFVDRFCNGDPDNDVLTGEYAYLGRESRRVEDWEQDLDPMAVAEFYGGDLRGILEKLDYLQELGVEVLYLNPIFVSPSNHKYDCQDYDYVDPHYGRIVKDGGELLAEGDLDNTRAGKYIQRTADLENLEASNELFIQLVEEIHRRGMRIILDGVFNHCGSFNKWMDREGIYEDREEYEKGAFVDENSPYRSFFQFYDQWGWPYNAGYEGWWGHDTLPKLNYEDSPALREYILEIGKKWVSPPYRVDGWRLDVAADLGRSREFNHWFWKEFRGAVKSANPEALILAEHYGDPGEWLNGEEWDSVMNYDAFMEPVTWFFTGMEKHSDGYREDLLGNGAAFGGAMEAHMKSLPAPALFTAMNELSNHDHSRFLTRTNRKVGRLGDLGPRAAEEGVDLAVFRAAVVLQMTWPGAPTVYYGDEAGLCGFTDPDNRRPYPWGREDLGLLDFHREAIGLRRNYPALRTGSLVFLECGQGLLAFGRFTRKEQLVVVIHSKEEEREAALPVWPAGIPPKGTVRLARIFYSGREGFCTKNRAFRVKDGILSVKMPPVSAMVFRRDVL